MKMQGEKLSKENIDSAYVNKTFKLIHYIDHNGLDELLNKIKLLL